MPFLQVANKLSAITCRASWQVQVEDIDFAKRLIPPFYLGVGYFIAFSPSQLCDEQVIMKTLHDHDTEAEIKTIQTQAVKCD